MSAAEERAKTAAAVELLGALPMPVGPGPLPQGVAEAQALDLLELMPEKSAAIVSGHLAVLLAQLEAFRVQRDELRARVAELEARDAALLTVMERVRDMAGDVMGTYEKPSAPGCSVWGLLSDLAVVRGLNRAPEHNQWSGAPYPDEPDDRAFEEASTHAEFVLPPAPGPSAEVSADRLTAFFAPVASLREDPHDGPLHRDYRVGRDLPEPGGAS